MLQPNKSKAKSYDDNFLDIAAESDLYKQWATPGKIKLAKTNAFNTEVHNVDLDTSNQDNLTEGINPFLNQFVDLNAEDPYNEIRANNQSSLSKLGSGVGRALTKGITEIAKMPGVVGGIIAAPFAEEGKGFETAFNNEWVKSLNKLNEDINTELLPVYVKKAVSEGNLWDNISSIDFWATEGADGIGYIASMFAPGAVLKSLNLGEKILGTTAKGLSLVNGEAKLAGATRSLTELGLTANNIDLAGITMANSIFEAGSEAGSAMENFEKDKDTFINNYINQGYSENEANTLYNEQKGRLGRDIFLTNMAILIGPNAIQSKMLFGKNGAKSIINQVEPTLLNKAGNRLNNLATATASEGFFEEGLQSTVETMFSESAKKGKLTNNIVKDFNIGELADNYLDMVTSTDGQKAIFLGGFLGGGMSMYQGAKQDIRDRQQSRELSSLTEAQVNNFNIVYETDVYQKDESGKIIQDNEGKPLYDPVKVTKVAEALKLTEEQNIDFENAVQQGNEELVNLYKNNAVNQLIIPYINKGEMGIDALKQYLDKSKETEEIADKNQDGSYDKLSEDIINKATYLQKQFTSFKSFSNDLIKLDQNELATDSDYTDFYNDLSDIYLNKKAEEYTENKKLKNLIDLKNQTINELTNNNLLEENTQFIDGITEPIYRNKKLETHPLIKQLDSKIEQSKNNLKDIDNIVNNLIWDKEQVNKAFTDRVNKNNKIREEHSPENIAETEQQIENINQATTEEELETIKTNNPIVEQKIVEKTDEIKIIQEENKLIQQEEAKVNESIEEVPNKTYDDLNTVEGSIITDELIPQTNDNNTLEELNSINTGNIDNGKGAKVISTNRNTGEPLDFINQFYPNYLAYEREPVDKTGKEVSFEINQNPGSVSDEVKEALKLFNNKDFSNTKLIYDYLPINVRFTPEVNAPIETKRKNGDIDKATELLRIEVISKLLEGQPISNIKTSIQGQYKGLLQIESKTAENNILNLDGVKGNLKYVRENLYVINAQGQLQNILNGETKLFNNLFNNKQDRIKENAKGEIYLMIPQANGQPFPLKLNIKKINDIQAELIFEIYKEILINEKSFNTTIKEINPNLQESINTLFNAELNIIGGNKQDIKLFEIIDLMIYSNSTNLKSQIRIEDNNLLIGDKSINVEELDNRKEEVLSFLMNDKRHQIKISPKSEIDNIKTNLQSNSADYLKYLLDNKILSTNAVINQPTFQGYTNIYLNPTVSLNNNFKPISNIENKLSKIKTLDELSNAYSDLNPEQQSQYKQLFTDRKSEIKTGINSNVQVGEGGVVISGDNFGGLDFGNQNINTPIQEDSAVTIQRDIDIKLERLDNLENGFKNITNMYRIDIIPDSAIEYLRIIFKDNSLVRENYVDKLKYYVSVNDLTSPKMSDLIRGVRETQDYKALLRERDSTKISDNIRNNENNFVPLSEIPQTMENNEVIKVQEEVYQIPTNPLERKQDITRLKALLKKIQSGKELRENEQKDLNKFKNAYPQEYEKIC